MVPLSTRQAEYQVRREVVRICHLLYQQGFISASDGNVSARLAPGRLLITPSGLHKGFVEPEQLLVIDEAGAPLGPRTAANRRLRPTSELPMHLEAYHQRPDIGAVVHAHPTTTIALSIAGISLTDCLIPEAIVMLGIIPTTEYATPSSTENQIAIRHLIAYHDVLVLQRHGSLTVGKDLMQAFMRLETLEQTARIALILTQLGVHKPLEPEEVVKLMRMREQMGLARPGEADAFCTACGVCHPDGAHVPQPAFTRPNGTPPATDPDEIRTLVAQVVRRTLGDTN